MQLYPAIDIKNGKCVRLYQGQFNQETIFNESPLDVAKQWERDGATYLHIIDLDGAINGKWVNMEVFRSILEAVKIPVQTGGGIRTLEDIKQRLDMGIERVIIGTMALKDPQFVKDAIIRFGAEHIVVGIDAKNGCVATHGWEQVSTIDAVEFALQMKMLGVKHIIYTDISKDGTMEGPNLDQTQNIILKTGMNIIASGGISCLEDLIKTQSIGAFGTIIGKALYVDAINLKEALMLFERGG